MTDSQTLRVRFAPSPTGSLHLGNARTALFNWLAARQAGGTLVLRVEDTDTVRRTEGSEEKILEDLRWLGLDWDEGPDKGGPFGPYRQSERQEMYARAAEQLLTNGRAYRCFCTIEVLEAERLANREAGRAPHYSGRCRTITETESLRRVEAGEPFAIRFATGADDPSAADRRIGFTDRLRGMVEFSLAELGDTVIIRADGRPTYNFAVVVDDAQMNINLVIRGDDHLSNTPRQILIFEALGQPCPEFVHLPMVRGEDGGRLSKRHGAMSVGEYRMKGYPVAGLLNALALMGWAPSGDRAVVSVGEMIEDFELDRVNRAPATFDLDKLDWICGRHIQLTPHAQLAQPVGERLVESGYLPEEALKAEDWLTGVVELLVKSIHHFDEVPARARGLFSAGGEPVNEDAQEALRADGAVAVVEGLASLAAADPPTDAESWKRLKAELKDRCGLKGKQLFHPLRVAITGELSGPSLDLMVPLVSAGSVLFPDRIVSIARRATETARWLG
jgi:nondiscriminating glutamyl-tRNA synthetase